VAEEQPEDPIHLNAKAPSGCFEDGGYIAEFLLNKYPNSNKFFLFGLMTFTNFWRAIT
jgi:hypothetical protein